MIIADVHAHLDSKEYDEDLEEVLQRAKTAGVKAVVCNGTDQKSNRKILKLSEKYEIIKAALGFYPCECDKVTEKEFDDEIRFIRTNKSRIIAIGEVGLDRKHDNDFEKQKICFAKLIKLAKELDKPIIIHSRKAEEEVISMLEEQRAEKVVMHCFSGKKKLAERIIKDGWCMSIPANVARSQQFQELVKMCPLKQLLTETDSPLLTHDPAIKRNEPAYITKSIKKISEIKGLDQEELSRIIFANYQRIFT